MSFSSVGFSLRHRKITAQSQILACDHDNVLSPSPSAIAHRMNQVFFALPRIANPSTQRLAAQAEACAT
jgi:hypothetical protein